MGFNLVVHDPDALFNIIDEQRRDQAVIEASTLKHGKVPVKAISVGTEPLEFRRKVER